MKKVQDYYIRIQKIHQHNDDPCTSDTRRFEHGKKLKNAIYMKNLDVVMVEAYQSFAESKDDGDKKDDAKEKDGVK